MTNSVTTSDDTELWHRVEDYRTECDSVACLYSYRVVRKTAKGVWLDTWYSRRFVLASARKRFAYPTASEAWDSFRARKRRQREILTAKIEHVERLLAKYPAEKA